MPSHDRLEATPASHDSAPSKWLPRVSVVLPIHNEARHIEACLERLIAQDYPRERLEILLVDGRSEDGTRDVLQRVQVRHPDVDLRLLDNPQRTVSHAMNVGIQAAHGEVIVRMDGHALPTDDYVSRCVAALEHSGAANAGGVFEAKGGTPFGEAVAVATEHPIGAGDAKYRIGGSAGDVDTVPYGAFRREVFETVGLYDESLVRNQDYELNVRIRATGERIYFDPAIRCTYTPRGTVRALWSQYFQYGWWKVETIRRHPSSLRWRQLVPPTFVAGVLALGLTAPWWPLGALAFWLAIGTYLIAVLAVSLRVARLRAAPMHVLVAIVVLHGAWSSGFLLNLSTIGRFPYRAGTPAVPRLSAGETHT